MIPRRVARRTARRTTRRTAARQGMYQQNDYPQESSSSNESNLQELERLYDLKERGAISEADYEQKKRELL
jgi:hypothetical protein